MVRLEITREPDFLRQQTTRSAIPCTKTNSLSNNPDVLVRFEASSSGENRAVNGSSRRTCFARADFLSVSMPERGQRGKIQMSGFFRGQCSLLQHAPGFLFQFRHRLRAFEWKQVAKSLVRRSQFPRPKEGLRIFHQNSHPWASSCRFGI